MYDKIIVMYDLESIYIYMNIMYQPVYTASTNCFFQYMQFELNGLNIYLKNGRTFILDLKK